MIHKYTYTGVDYLEFLDLDADDGAELREVLPDRSGMLSSDYVSNPIFVSSGIPIGARPDLTTVLYVSTTDVMKCIPLSLPFSSPSPSPWLFRYSISALSKLYILCVRSM